MNFKFCPSCGIGRSQDKDGGIRNEASSSNENSESKNARPMPSLQLFMSKKQEERASHFRPSKKARVANKQEVTINIGVMELDEKEIGIPLRGKSLPLKIAKDANYDTLLESALKKRADYDKTFDCERAYKLVYPDGQSAQTIPGAIELFTLVKYKEGLGKSYGRITLYLCPIFALPNDVKLDEEFPSESDSEGIADFPIGISSEIATAAETIEIKDEVDEQEELPAVHPVNCEDPFCSTDFL